MSAQIDIDLNENHIGGGFTWEVEPNCSCGMLKKAIEDEKFIFVSNFVSEGANVCYIFPVTSEGDLARRDGVAITNCPWCGDRIKGFKKYPKPQNP